MDDPGLSHRELLILAEIEHGLRTEPRLDRALRRMRRGPRWLLGGLLRRAVRVPVSAFAVLVALSAGLLSVCADDHPPGVLVVFGLVWAPTLLLAVGRLVGHRKGFVG
ncbi:hypothetical protein AB0O91_00490 [Kitasatospora sp. NPDC089797]|uniref:hypothetical protein n=1 Tax=Kitasatospora sp. NPDC089797 TaxID=3155298 RepID=UPI003418DAC1